MRIEDVLVCRPISKRRLARSVILKFKTVKVRGIVCISTKTKLALKPMALGTFVVMFGNLWSPSSYSFVKDCLDLSNYLIA